MRKFLGLALILLSLTVLPTRAQDDIHLSTVSVEIWPEYDQPSVLVIYNVTLAAKTTLPASLTFYIPAQAQIYLVATRDETGELTDAQYERTPLGEWAALRVTISSPHLRFEYYDILRRTNNRRRITFDWAGDYPVDLLEINFLQPRGATNVVINHPSHITAPKYGLTNHLIRSANLAVGQHFTLHIEYNRPTNDLSIAGLPIKASSPLGPDTPGRISAAGILPWALGGAGILLVVGAVTVGFFSGRRGRRPTRPPLPTRPRRRIAAELICPHCGKRAQAGDSFCRTCGTRLRREAGN